MFLFEVESFKDKRLICEFCVYFTVGSIIELTSKEVCSCCMVLQL